MYKRLRIHLTALSAIACDTFVLVASSFDDAWLVDAHKTMADIAIFVLGLIVAVAYWVIALKISEKEEGGVI